MAAVLWDTDKDKALLGYRERNVAWETIASAMKISVYRLQRRHAKLLAGTATVNTAAKRADPVSREDGLDRLIRKGKLRQEQIVQARLYRSLYRTAELSGGVLKSCLNVTVGGSGHDGMPLITEAYLQQAEADQATRRLFCIRMILLAGQEDLLTVLDGVCGVGQTVRELAGGDGHRANEWEAILRIALDIMHFDAHGGRKKAA